jgi:hypothetical protein
MFGWTFCLRLFYQTIKIKEIMINVPFLLKIILQIIELLLGSDVFGDDEKSTLQGIVDNVNTIRAGHGKH